MHEPIIAVRQLNKVYTGKPEPAVVDITFSLRPGEIMALIGPNGAGKTTTIKMILGLVLPTSGNVNVAGFDMTQERQRQQGARRIGAVLEGARNVYWRLSARHNLEYFGTLRGLHGRPLHTRIDALLDLLDLTAVANREVRFFSRGMQQKVAIAAALLHDPDVLLLDEPTLGLDVQAAQTLEESILRLSDNGMAILLTTHQMGLAQRLSHATFVIHQGRQIQYKQTAALLQEFQVQEAVEIRVAGLMGSDMKSILELQFPALSWAVENGQTALTWSQPQQRDVARLFAVLDEMDYTVLKIQRREATLAEIFLSLTAEPAR